jgi:hypothetical protein
MPPLSRPLLLAPLLLAACAVNDSRIADQARTRLMGLSEVDLESCLGAPDQRGSFGSTDILTYYTTSSSSISYAIPVVGGIGLTNGGNCHATFQVRDGRVAQLLYSGEKNATLAPDAYCAPIVRTCLEHLDRLARAAARPTSGGRAPAPAPPAPAMPPAAPALPAQATPPGAGTPPALP